MFFNSMQSCIKSLDCNKQGYYAVIFQVSHQRITSQNENLCSRQREFAFNENDCQVLCLERSFSLIIVLYEHFISILPNIS
uniref:Uncharacterized protein n=1 Tax=Anguilla anguilla TaxID=7936 RepID=A0A0E9XEG6_ANGAN